jgi:hypothetical protein
MAPSIDEHDVGYSSWFLEGGSLLLTFVQRYVGLVRKSSDQQGDAIEVGAMYRATT